VCGCSRRRSGQHPELPVPVARQIVLQVAVRDIGQLTDFEPRAHERFSVARTGTIWVFLAVPAGQRSPGSCCHATCGARSLTKALADGRLVLTVDPASTVQLASAARASYPNIVAAVAVAIAESAASGTWLCLKSCTAPYCGQAFYDDSDPSASSAAKRCSMHTA
jgi:hypothetical protein